MFIAVFVAVIIVLNMVASLLTEKIPALTFDLSTTKTTQLSQDTIDFLQTIKKDVTITVLADESQYTSANEYYLMANTVLKQYHNQNNKITIKYIDLTANPTFVSKYPDDTLSAGNYIVECGDKHRILTIHIFISDIRDDMSHSLSRYINIRGQRYKKLRAKQKNHSLFCRDIIKQR